MTSSAPSTAWINWKSWLNCDVIKAPSVQPAFVSHQILLSLLLTWACPLQARIRARAIPEVPWSLVQPPTTRCSWRESCHSERQSVEKDTLEFTPRYPIILDGFGLTWGLNVLWASFNTALLWNKFYELSITTIGINSAAFIIQLNFPHKVAMNNQSL